MQIPIPQRPMATGLLFGLGLFAVTVAAALWRQSAEACRRAKADEEALLRLDSDLG